MPLTVLFFASARDAAGVSKIEIDILPTPQQPTKTEKDPTTTRTSATTITDTDSLRKWLVSRYPSLSKLMMDDDDDNNKNYNNITLAVNQEYVTHNTELQQHDTVALIPPISGG